jgi:glycosyltransferase involved in cell wall biosynthesis
MDGYAKYLGGLIRNLGLQDCVDFTGPLSAEEVAAELVAAHVFVTPSMVENGCNALQEAALVGTPSVVSLAGGMTSMIDDGVTAIGFPRGNEAMLAEGISMLFADDTLSLRLSAAARAVGHVRNCRESIVWQIKRIYDSVIEIHKKVI